MLKPTTADAIAALQEALATLPSELEARSEFFVQWRAHTAQVLETAFPDDHEPVRSFKEIEFSPRRLPKDEKREAQLRLDAYLAGCAAARTLIESLLWRLNTASTAEKQKEDAAAASPPAPEAKPATRPEPQSLPESLPEPPSVSLPAPLREPAPVLVPEPPPLVIIESSRPARQDPAPLACSARFQSNFPSIAAIAGGTMDSREVCGPVRSSMARVLSAWEKGDRDMAMAFSAQLLAELTLLSRNEPFKAVFDNMVSKAFDASDANGANGAAEVVKDAAPLCVWSLVAAMTEVMKN